MRDFRLGLFTLGLDRTANFLILLERIDCCLRH